MPGVSGPELTRRFGELAPDVPVAVTSGCVAEVAGGDPAGVAWLQKPFGATALLAAIDAALGSRVPAARGPAA